MRFLLFLVLTLVTTSVYATYPTVVVQTPTIIKRHSVEFDANTFIGTTGLYAVQDKLKLELANSHEADKQATRDLAQAVLKLVDKLDKCQPNGIAVEQPQNPQPQSAPSQNQAVSGSDLDKKVYDIFKRSCAGCHSTRSNSGGLLLINDQGGLYDLSAKQRFNVHFRTFGVNLKLFNKNLMPLNGNPLADGDVSLIYDWAVAKNLAELAAEKK